jgi:hypothetical protein
MIHPSIFQFHSHAAYPQTINQYMMSHLYVSIHLCHELYHPTILLHTHHHLNGSIDRDRLPCRYQNNPSRLKNPPKPACLVHIACHCEIVQYTSNHRP